MEKDAFGETPDPRFYFPLSCHHQAMSALSDSIRTGKGFSVMTGEVGTGKTLLTRVLLGSLKSQTSSALILYPNCTEAELLRSICEELEIRPTTHRTKPATPLNESSHKRDLDLINRFLLVNAERGKKTVLVIDEAQSIPVKTLETIRLLSNLETASKKLIQIILVAQPEFEIRLGRTDLRQLKQRIGVWTRLSPILPEETESYLRHRIEVAGGGNLLRFDPKAAFLVHQLGRGVPRDINRICQTIVETCYRQKVRLIKTSTIQEALGIPSFFGWITRLWNTPEAIKNSPPHLNEAPPN